MHVLFYIGYTLSVDFAMLNTPGDASSAGSKTMGPSPFEKRFSPEDLVRPYYNVLSYKINTVNKMKKEIHI